MRLTRSAVPIGIISALIILGGITAGLTWARGRAPAAPTPDPMVVQTQAPEGQTDNPAPQHAPDSGLMDGLMDPLPTPSEGSVSQFPIPEKPELRYPNLGSSLDQMAVGVEEGEVTAKEAAEGAPVHQEESVAVTIHLSGNVDDVVSFLEDNGGSPRNVGEDYIEAYVPVTLLGQVSEQPGVLRVRTITPPEPAGTNFFPASKHGASKTMRRGAVGIPEKPEPKYPNLGSSLDQPAAGVEEGEVAAEKRERKWS